MLALWGLAPKLKRDLNSEADITLGQVWVSDSHQPICIPVYSAKVVSSKTNNITKHHMCMVKARESNKLPIGVVVNRTIVTPNKSKCIPVLVMNTNSYNVWICQPLLTTDVVEAEHCPWDYQSFFSYRGYEVKVSFHPVPNLEVQEEILSSAVNNSDISNSISNSKEQGKRSKFRPQPKLNSPDFDFQPGRNGDV